MTTLSEIKARASGLSCLGGAHVAPYQQCTQCGAGRGEPCGLLGAAETDRAYLIALVERMRPHLRDSILFNSNHGYTDAVADAEALLKELDQ